MKRSEHDGGGMRWSEEMRESKRRPGEGREEAGRGGRGGEPKLLSLLRGRALLALTCTLALAGESEADGA